MTFVIFLVMTRLSLIWKAYKVNVNKFYKQARIEKFKYIFYYEIVVCFFSFFFFYLELRLEQGGKIPNFYKIENWNKKCRLFWWKPRVLLAQNNATPKRFSWFLFIFFDGNTWSLKYWEVPYFLRYFWTWLTKNSLDQGGKYLRSYYLWAPILP